MGAAHLSIIADPTAACAPEVEAMRAAFRKADKPMRQMLMPLLPPCEVEFAGIRMFVDPRDNYTERRIWLDGQPPEMKSLMALVGMVEGKQALVLDVGANCGAYAVPLALAVAEGSRVIAFEPNPVMIGRLGHNARINGLGQKLRIEGCALGASDGEAVLNFRADNFGQASLMPVPERVRDGGTLVPVRPLDAFVQQAAHYEICVLKIDVEGGEEAVLAPMLDAAPQGGWLPDVILIETVHADTWATDLTARIVACGYRATMQAEGNTLFVRASDDT